jgi:hypothetical protein
MTWLRDWLNGDVYPRQDRVKVAMTHRPASLVSLLHAYPETSYGYHILRKEKAAGLAPYVGEPFVYIWFVGTDELGRSVAGDATIQPL